jgi:hypothetical protein
MSTFAERARARATWPIRRTTLAGEPLTDERLPESINERVALVARLTELQWALSGLPLPTYRRNEMPGRVLRPAR